jgi:dihydrofolate reductase
VAGAKVGEDNEMKVILYMAISVNGIIAKLNHDTPWTDAELESYTAKVKEIGNLILGKTTYDLMEEEEVFSDLGDPYVVVLTSSREKPKRKNTIFVKNFDEAINELTKKNFEIALVAGGSKADNAALESKKLDEIYLDIEPLVLGKGIPLFSPSEFDLNLELLESKKIGNSGIQLRYKVL